MPWKKEKWRERKSGLLTDSKTLCKRKEWAKY